MVQKNLTKNERHTFPENWRSMTVSCLRADASEPVRLSDEEVPWPGDAVLPREHGLDVPRQQPVQGRVDQEHPHGARHRELVVEQRRLPDVVPLRPDPGLLVVREVGATEAERHVGDQTLE